MAEKTEGTLEQLFQKFGHKLDVFVSDLKGSKTTASAEIDERFEELKSSFSNLEDQVKEFKENNKDKWEDVQSELNQAGKSLKHAFDTAFTKKNE